MKKLFVVTVLALSSLTIAGAKSYEIVLSNATKAGAVQLKPGQYKVKVDGSNVTFTDVNTTKSFTTPAKVQTTEQKFDATKVQTTKDGDTERLQEIDLGGSKTKLEF